jgi:hypothetical protein
MNFHNSLISLTTKANDKNSGTRSYSRNNCSVTFKYWDPLMSES